MSDFPAIKLTKVSKRFKYLLAANNISLEITKNEVVAFIGPNGAGKSTLLNLIAGVIKPTFGLVSINHQDLTEHTPSLKKNIILFSYYSFLYDDLTGLENLEFWLKLYDIKQRKQLSVPLRDYILDLSSQFGIKNWLSRPVRELSTGMRKKIDFLRAILIEPDFLLLDEPFSGMDLKNIDFFIKIIENYKSKATICIVSHDIDIISAISDRVFIIEKGKIVEEANASDYQNRLQLQDYLTAYFQKIT